MTGHLVTRAASSLVLMLAIVCGDFLLIHMTPGDPVEALVGDFPAPPAYVREVRHTFGLDRPLSDQLWLYIRNLANGNFGFSFANRQPVLPLLLSRAKFTLMLMLPALVIASCSGVLLGMLSAYHARTLSGTMITSLSLIGYSLPVFWLAQLLILFFAVRMRWLPAQGLFSTRGEYTGWALGVDMLRHLVLPCFSVSVYYTATNARVARSSILELIHRDFVRTALAKGLMAKHVWWRHVLPNALIPIVTVIGYNFGYALTGAILTETVFGWPGIGNLFYVSIANRDYPVLQGTFILTAFSVICANFVTDLLYARLDPRLRGQG